MDRPRLAGRSWASRSWAIRTGLPGLALLALAILSACGGKYEAGTPSALAAFQQFAGGGGAASGGGGGGFKAVAYDDTLLYGPPGTGGPPAEINIFCESVQGATQYVLMERDKGSSAAFAQSAGQSGVQALTNGAMWTFTLPTSDKEYQVEAQDGSGTAVDTSNTITTDIAGAKTTFAITQPNNGTWIDLNTGQIVTPPSVAAPAQLAWDQAAQDYVLWCLEIAPTISGGNLNLNASLDFIGLAKGQASFDVQSGLYLQPAQGAPFSSGTEYLIMIIGCDGNGWGVATTIDLFNPQQAGPWGGAFVVQ